MIIMYMILFNIVAVREEDQEATDEGLEAGDFQSCGIDVFFDYIVGVRCLLGY